MVSGIIMLCGLEGAWHFRRNRVEGGQVGERRREMGRWGGGAFEMKLACSFHRTSPGRTHHLPSSPQPGNARHATTQSGHGTIRSTACLGLVANQAQRCATLIVRVLRDGDAYLYGLR